MSEVEPSPVSRVTVIAEHEDGSAWSDCIRATNGDLTLDVNLSYGTRETEPAGQWAGHESTGVGEYQLTATGHMISRQRIS